LPELPTLNEAGLPGYESVAWWGMLAPAATPKAIVTKLNGAVVKSLNADETKERLAREGAEVAATSPAQFGEFLRRETQKWARVVKASGMKVE
jgi:tripartite-type tricarboxylate transporter receptor subunit TctC